MIDSLAELPALLPALRARGSGSGAGSAPGAGPAPGSGELR